MKKLLLVSIIFVFAVFLYQNVELDLHKEMVNEDYTEPRTEIEQTTSNKGTSSNKLAPNNQAKDQYKPQIDPEIKEDPEIKVDPQIAEQDQESKPDILSLIQKVSFEDQIKVANILIKRFSFSELNEYRMMVNNGITEEEKEEIKKTVLSRLSEEDLIGLKKIAEGYVVEYYPDQQERFNSLANRYLEQQ